MKLRFHSAGRRSLGTQLCRNQGATIGLIVALAPSGHSYRHLPASKLRAAYVSFWREEAIPGTVTFFARAEIIAALPPS